MSGETSFGKQVGNLELGVHIPNCDSWIFPNSFEEPIEINSMCSGDMAHSWAAAFDGHFDDSIVVFQNQ
jgi:hypothetical protein